jgi:Holliday junction DNA helicase RuvA
MIARLSGILAETTSDSAVIDVSGVGYLVHLSGKTLGALTSIQGVGGRLALAILSVLSPDELARAVAQGDKAMIGRANGVGPKLAARIANELQGKLGVTGVGGAAPAPRGGAAADALSALANLGFRPAEASAAVNAAQDDLGPEATLDALVRLALKKAAK